MNSERASEWHSSVPAVGISWIPGRRRIIETTICRLARSLALRTLSAFAESISRRENSRGSDRVVTDAVTLGPCYNGGTRSYFPPVTPPRRVRANKHFSLLFRPDDVGRWTAKVTLMRPSLLSSPCRNCALLPFVVQSPVYAYRHRLSIGLRGFKAARSGLNGTVG